MIGVRGFAHEEALKQTTINEKTTTHSGEVKTDVLLHENDSDRCFKRKVGWGR